MIYILINIIIFILLLTLLFWLRIKSEKKQFSNYEESKQYLPKNIEAIYRGFIITKPAFAYQTNRIKILLTNKSIMLYKKGTNSKKYSLEFDFDDITYLKCKKISKSKTKLSIYHNKYYIDSPYEVQVDIVGSSEISLLEKLCKNYE